MTDDVRTLLWEHASDPDAYFEGMLLAAERIGLVRREEILEPVPARGDRAAAEPHLERLLAGVRPLSRREDPERLRAGHRFMGALDALVAAGLVEREPWAVRELEAEAPWLEPAEVERITTGEGFFAIHVPATTPEEEAQDAEWARRAEALHRASPLLRVAVCRTPARADGLAIVAALVRSECVDLHFHRVGGRALDQPPPPALTDDAGTTYEPLVDWPIRGPAPSAAWRYQPAPPAEAARFTAAAGATRWELEPPRLP